MSNLGNFSRRLFAGLLAVLMVFGLLPIPGIRVANAEAGVVTVVVRDENGDPVSEASVEYAITNGEATVVSGTQNTDTDGKISIDYDEYADGMILTGSASKSGYVTASINRTITSVSESVEVMLERPEITDITLAAKENLKYTGEDLALVETPSFQDGDTVAWKVANKETGAVLVESTETSAPTQKDVGTYTVQLTVNRDGFKPFAKTVEVSIGKGTISGISLKAKDGLVYSGEKQALVTVEGTLDTDTVAWSLNDASYTLEAGETVPGAVNAGEYKVGISVSRENYEDYTDEVTVTIEKAEITDISLSPLNPTYTGEAQDLVSPVEGLAEGDTVAWKVNGDPVTVETDKVPTGTNAGNYTVTATVSRNDNYETKNLEVTATIATAQTGISISKRADELVFNGTEQALVDLTGTILDSDTVEWKVNNEAVTLAEGQTVPTAKDAGEYTVSLRLERANYTTVDITVEGIIINRANINTNGLEVATNTLTYNGSEQALVTVTGQSEGYSLQYKVGDEDWSLDVPSKTNAGNYTVYVRAVNGSNYNPKVVLDAGTAVINQAELVWNTKPEKSEYTILGAVPFSEQYSFLAAKQSGDAEFTDAEVISYSIDDASNSIAEINGSTGSLTVKYPGTINVTVTIPNTNNNFKKASISTTITVNSTVEESGDHYLKFVGNPSEYVLGTNEGVISEAAVSADNKVTGSISYEMTPNEQAGIAINSNTGKVTVSDWAVLENAVAEANNALSVTVTAKKDAEGFYGSDAVQYSFTIRYANDEEAIYELIGEKGTNVTEAETGWYVGNVTIKPAEGYKVAIGAAKPDEFNNDETVSTEAVNEVVILLQNNSNGEISRLTDTIKVDKTAPSSTVRYYIDAVEVYLENITLGFYKGSLTIKFESEDAVSGSDGVQWFYESQVERDESGYLVFEDGKVELTLEAQRRGKVSYSVYDKAGNTVEKSTGEFVLDTISPEMSVTYTKPNLRVGTIDYYGTDKIDVTINVTEANFDPNDFHVVLTKDGDSGTDISSEIKWYPEAWTAGANQYTGTYAITGEGDYFLGIDYTDASGNEMQSYVSNQLSIDTTKPTLTVAYAPTYVQVKDNVEQYDSDITATFSLTERNFYPEDVEITLYKEGDEEGTDISSEIKWRTEGDSYLRVAEYTIDTDWRAYYITVEYTDKSGNQMEGYQSNKMTLDKVAPTFYEDDRITYSDPINSWWDGILEAISFGFYNPQSVEYITVTFTAYDETAGVEYFKWALNYSVQDSASLINVQYEDEIAEATQDEQDPTKYTAEVQIPLPKLDEDGNEIEGIYDQIRGMITVEAFDFSWNSNAFKDEETIIVSDTVAPELEVGYSEASRIENGVRYYGSDKGGSATITLTITEANFFEEDVVVTVSKQGAEDDQVSPVWTNQSSDVHVGTYTLRGDGHYTVTVDYTDRSKNKMTTYTSPLITLDTVEPTIGVSYKNANLVERIAVRDYFADTQTAVVTVTEHNFKADEVVFTVNGTEYSTANNNTSFGGGVTASAWTNNGDVHTLVITFSGENNYTFDVAYTDLATNEAADYAGDQFTVDRTPPTNLTITYSQSVLDTVLNGVTFGFYQNRVNVTLTATDATAGIRRFTYSYTTAGGVSGVNSGMNGQTVDVSQMTQQGNTWTYTFSIPQAALDSNNQFNGTVSFTAIDCSGNSSGITDGKRIVVDNIAPNGTLSFNTPSNVENDVTYYSGNVTGTIEITEANFYSSDVSVTATKDGGEPFTISTTWTDQNVDSHTGTFTLSEDGDYIVTVSYRDKSGNGMATQTSKQITVDHQIDPATITINDVEKSGNAGAYNGDIDLQFAFADTNLDTVTYSLTRTSASIKNEDVSSFVTVGDYEKEGTGSISIPREVSNDGIYDLTITVKDKAGNEETSHVRFAVCRFGSVYEYSDYLISLIQEGSNYHKSADGTQPAITDDLIITEYNATDLADGSLKISITRDGELVDANFDVSKVATEEPDWYQYVYTISKDNFSEDGVYSISLSSEYSAADSDNNIVRTSSISVPENSNVKDIMQFVVDTTAPDIRNITNLENRIINESEITVNFTIVDVGGLQKVEVVLNGQIIDTITNFGDDVNTYSGSFKITESTQEQTIQIIATDIAGNITDTSSDGFNPGGRYTFNNAVTVSTNAFVRFYANKPLFWGSVGGVAVLAGGAGAAVVVRRRKKEAA